MLDDPAERHRESEDALDNLLAGGGNSEGPLNGAEHLFRRAEVETARVANGKDRSARRTQEQMGVSCVCESFTNYNPQISEAKFSAKSRSRLQRKINPPNGK